MRIQTLAISAALFLTAAVGFQNPVHAQATPDVVVTATTANNAKVIQSYKENDYNMYVAATGETSNDALHIRFNKERNAYLSGNTPIEPATVTPVTSNNKVIQSYKENDYNMYVAATGETSNDALHIRFNKERNAYLGGTPVQPNTETPATSTDEAMKIRSYTDYDYNMYVKATGGVSNDEVHIRFNAERNAYLTKMGIQPATTENQSVKPGPRTKPNKPRYNENRGNRILDINKSKARSNRGKIIINLIFN
jgi:hypothetical protein